jgi:hypothetical protein
LRPLEGKNREALTARAGGSGQAKADAGRVDTMLVNFDEVLNKQEGSEMAVAWPDSDKPVEGYRIGWSFKSKAVGLLGGLLMLPVGSAVVWAWCTGLTIAGWRFNPVGGMLGALAFALSLLMIPLGIATLFRRRDLILGTDRLQILGNEDNVVAQVPYKNISRVGIVKGRYGKYIAFEFFNPRDPNTLNAGRGEADADGWHCRLLGDSWTVPLEYIYARLYAALQVQSGNDQAVQARPERSPPGSVSEELTGSLSRERQA